MPVALITGGASGIGFASAQRFAAAGSRVLLWDVDGAKVAAAAKAIGNAEGLAVDLGDVAAVKAAAASAIGRHGKIDALVGSAGISGRGLPFAEIDQTAFDDMMNIHVRGHFFLLQALVPAMPPGSAAVLVSSIYARVPPVGMAHYAAAKGALLSLTKALAGQLGPVGIRVNAVTPGLIRTPMTEASARGQEAFFADRAAVLPLRRLTTTEEVAATIVWLLSAEAGSLTGQGISPSSGEVMAD
jgi:3-oxoacyl-[acyl-carrier protein] reductase